MQAVTITQITANEFESLIEKTIKRILGSQKSFEPDGDQLLTIKQAGELIKLSVPTIYGYVSRNEIPFSKKGKRLYFSKQQLFDWVQEGRKKTKAEIATGANSSLLIKKGGKAL